MNDLITTEHDSPERRLTAAQFQGLAEVPAAATWFANLDNPRTRRAYQGDIGDDRENGQNRTLSVRPVRLRP